MGKTPHPPRNVGASKKAPAEPSKDGDKSKKKAVAGQPAPDASSKSKGKGKKPVEEPPAVEEPPKKPTARQLIGGSSWTGKLPVNLLSEHCQKQKWEKPDYSMSKTGDNFWSTVTLSRKNPKTQEMTTLPPFRLPKSHQELSNEPSALEARHFAAAYTLFRINSKTNLHMMMPPKYKDLWKIDFTELKKADEEEGRAWQYASDPFLAAQEREDKRKAQEKKAEQIKKANEEKAKDPRAVLHGGASGDLMKGWKTAPKIDMGKLVRREVERLVRTHAIWNPESILMDSTSRGTIMKDLINLDFRKSHVDEALEIAHNKEEALEWLIIHVPEEDLPKWCLPENYSAGVTFASGNMKRETAVKRLSLGGYPVEVCEDMYDAAEGNELVAAEKLQNSLLGTSAVQADLSDVTSGMSLDDQTQVDTWTEEQEVIASILEGRFSKLTKTSCKIRLETQQPLHLIVQRPSSGYPQTLPVLSLEGKLPSYIKLSITRQALLYCKDNLLGDQMIFNIVDWIEQEASRIIESPGRLTDVSSATMLSDERHTPVSLAGHKRKRPHPRPLDLRPGTEASLKMLKQWETRQSEPKQQTMMQARQSLPAWQLRERIAEAVRNHQVTIISGETGSGKSTQSVQFILDDMIQLQLGNAVNIICTQPRRISALGLADRVADERCSSVGQEVGYAIRGDSKQTSGTTKITFVTTGILLRRLQTSGGSAKDVVDSIADVSCIVVDEVHERSVDSDFLLCLLRDVLKARKDLKLVLMSATLDAEVFERYFSGQSKVAKVEIAGRTHPVTDYYLDDIVMFLGMTNEVKQSWDDDGYQDSGYSTPNGGIDPGKAIQSLGMGINYKLIARLVDYIDRDLGDGDGAILIFLPGVAEISKTLDALSSSSHLQALPLHAGLLPSEQRRVFPRAPRGRRKVIASTNVAETSITIPDVVAVIDSGRVKETRFDPVTSMVKLEECWASRAACKQRRGRAGRVSAGNCFKLFTKSAEYRMAERPEPEIRRMPLEQLCLSVKAMGVADVSKFLMQTLTPPESLAVEGALKLLSRVGALDGDTLTPLGQHMAMLPTDLRCAKLMVYGILFGCFDPCVTIASILTIKSPFVSPQDKRDEAKSIRTSFSDGQGDIFADLNAYEQWSSMRSSPSEMRFWCRENFLSPQTLNDIASTRSQYIAAMKDTGFLPASFNSRDSSADYFNRHGTSSMALLQSLILSALNPNTLRIVLPSQKFQASISGATAIDPEAREIRFFDASNNRAFIHPSSTLFSAQTFTTGAAQASFMSYWQKVETSKAFVRELSPAGVYALCLFGGAVEIDAHGRGLLVDGWARIRGWARIGVLLGRIKAVMEDILRRWIEDPASLHNAARREQDEQVVKIVKRLVELEGMDH